MSYLFVTCYFRRVFFFSGLLLDRCNDIRTAADPDGLLDAGIIKLIYTNRKMLPRNGIQNRNFFFVVSRNYRFG